MSSHGLTLGKFLPLHQGHALLLRAAAIHCDVLTVLVGVTSEDPYSFETRARWIRTVLSGIPASAKLQLQILEDPDPDPQVTKDESGTATDEHYWQQWLGQNAAVLEQIDTVFTSDRYGAEIARRTGTRWFPIDPDREVIPVSARQIRADHSATFEFVSDVAKPDVAVTVAVVGAESTGKSTLVKRLAQDYGTRYAPEWGRIISEAHAQLSVADFDAILTMQDELIRTAQRTGNGLCFTDTEAITTALFAPIYLGKSHEPAWRCAEAQDFALYLVLDPTVPWIDDGTRVLDDAERLSFHESLIKALTRLGKPFEIIAGDSYSARLDTARRAVDRVLAAWGRID